MSLSDFCCTLLKFYSQSCSGAVCFPPVARARLLAGGWARAGVLRSRFCSPTGWALRQHRHRAGAGRSQRGGGWPARLGPPLDRPSVFLVGGGLACEGTEDSEHLSALYLFCVVAFFSLDKRES